MTPTWYDLLGVAPDASADEIRAAWRDGIADLDPGDRRFETRNKAAAVLLDPAQRATYDASLADDVTSPEPVAAATGNDADVSPLTHQESTREKARIEKARSKELSKRQAAERRVRDRERAATVDATPRSTSGVPTWMLVALGALAVVMVAATVVVWLRPEPSVEEESRAAQAAAEQAVVPVVSYGYETLEEDRAEAEGFLTGTYREEYDKLFTVIEQNAPETQTTVGASVVSSGIVRTGDDRVDVLVFVDRPTTNKLNPEPVVYRDQVTLSMRQVGDEWLVDDMITSPAQG